MMKNAFYFMFKALFVLEIFTFLSRPFGYVEKRLDQKTKVNFRLISRFLTPQTGHTIITTMYIFLNISRSKFNHTTKFGHFIEYKMIDLISHKNFTLHFHHYLLNLLLKASWICFSLSFENWKFVIIASFLKNQLNNTRFYSSFKVLINGNLHQACHKVSYTKKINFYKFLHATCQRVLIPSTVSNCQNTTWILSTF